MSDELFYYQAEIYDDVDGERVWTGDAFLTQKAAIDELVAYADSIGIRFEAWQKHCGDVYCRYLGNTSKDARCDMIAHGYADENSFTLEMLLEWLHTAGDEPVDDFCNLWCEIRKRPLRSEYVPE